ncbi:hypothetical protein GCM10023214_62260 [Amycolatopsis dongchuanensis]|uniref:Uncharacterized protein n=1 Tax=Amycolatopsis dongchuanensis TaxID=1070866 RepID=A0ABP8VFP1_9PSEU
MIFAGGAYRFRGPGFAWRTAHNAALIRLLSALLNGEPDIEVAPTTEGPATPPDARKTTRDTVENGYQ